MSVRLRQSTAITLRVGPLVDSADGVTPEISLTISQGDRKFSKAGAALAQTSDTNAATHDSGGFYYFSITATDTNTVGPLLLSIQESGAAPFWQWFEVIPAAVYDADVAGTNVRGSLHYGTAQSGSSLAVALATSASSTDDYYNGQRADIIGGTGAGQSRLVTDYTGSLRSCTIDRAWVTTPDNTSVVTVMPIGFLLSTEAAIVDAVWDESMSGALGAYNARPTARQAMAEITLQGRTVVQSTNNLLVKDTDGTTTVRTLALAPDATTPTSRTVTA